MKHVSRSLSNENMTDKRICTVRPKKLESADKIHSMTYKREGNSGGDLLSALLQQKLEDASLLWELISARRPNQDQEDASCSGSKSIADDSSSHGDQMLKAKERLQVSCLATFRSLNNPLL